ncbi:sensor domain-containing diguanylate cyclase [Paucibacter sp. TC2R-5]|uniref:sensor domain-containing diguanylate cyclase n=1 Tax=Paucibacter sp. TC2R-5 TaxID=2893555 RepID=UPI0021E3F606|nr:sensor domain-containing diguanylate cyclase [Paucibacter sp. TC2R-5]MCV2360076.1 sensor domain-containing diguanylate cyclase [Paucibacter sp. TC2R-5]
MINSYAFLLTTINSLSEHIVVIDRTGLIRFVNRAWTQFGQENSCPTMDWTDVNYLAVCDSSADYGEEFSSAAAKGIRNLIAAGQGVFNFEYPCNSPDEVRWFMMTVKPFDYLSETYFLISHQNITKRKAAEEAVMALSRLDGLTGIFNRRWFNEFLAAEWNRCARLQVPISLAMIDIDFFKLLNDHYGHQAGDDCLIRIAETLSSQGKRPGDICARYGGEEFVYVFGNTNIEQAMVVLERLMAEIRQLQIPNEKSTVLPTVTVSIGLAMMYPQETNTLKELINLADKRLFAAKLKGRNQIVST